MAAEDFTNKTYIITGGFSGIGLAVVKTLFTNGATIHAIDKAHDFPADQITTDKTALEQRLFTYPGVDVSSRDRVSETFTTILERTPIVDGIVNSAGIAPVPEIADPIESDERFERIMGVNMRGTWNVATAYFRHVLDRTTSTTTNNQDSGSGAVPEGIGSVVNIASTGAMHAFPGMTTYCASKHAVLGLTRSWAKDFGPRGVRVNCVAPGGTETNISGELVPAVIKAYTSMVPLGRLARAQEVAEVVGFLLSARAGFVNGQMVPVEGGTYSF